MIRDPKYANEKLKELFDSIPDEDDEGYVYWRENSDDAILPARKFITLELKPKKRILGQWLTKKSITLVYAWRGVGKTWWALALGTAITSGKNFGPWPVNGQVRCLILDAEMASQDLQKRLSKLNKATPISGRLFIWSEDYRVPRGYPRSYLTDKVNRNKIKRYCRKKKIRFLIIDNLASLTPRIDENSKRDWDPIIDWFRELRFSGICVIAIHHSGKSGSLRGSSALEDNADVIIRLGKARSKKSAKGLCVKMTFRKARNVSGLEGKSEFIEILSSNNVPHALKSNSSYGESGTRGNSDNSESIELKRKLLSLLGTGKKQVEIADELGRSEPWVSKYKKRAISKGFITRDGNLTAKGKKFVTG